METVVDATIATDQYVVEETIERIPDVELEFVRVAITSSASTMPFLWGSTGEPARLDAALADDPSTERVTRLSGNDGRGLYSVDWTTSAAARIEEFAESAGSVLDVRGTSDGWTFRMLFPDRETAGETLQTWCDDGVGPSVSRITSLSCRDGEEGGMSGPQHSAIAQAFQTDYYTVPRGTTLEELATDFDVSHQALSERLRRGHSHLVERMLSESTATVERRP